MQRNTIKVRDTVDLQNGKTHRQHKSIFQNVRDNTFVSAILHILKDPLKEAN